MSKMNNDTDEIDTSSSRRKPSLPLLLGLIAFLVWSSIFDLNWNRNKDVGRAVEFTVSKATGNKTFTNTTSETNTILSTVPTPSEEKEAEEGMHYHWIDNQWIPPRNVPHYTPFEMLELFRRENTLWIGDSTSRRSYATMYAMIQGADSTKNATSTSDVHLRLDLSRQNVNSPAIIDVNKRIVTEPCFHRSFDPKVTVRKRLVEYVCRQVPGSMAGSMLPTPAVPRKQATGAIILNGTEIPRSGLCDYGKINCYKDVLNLLKAEDRLPPGNLLTQEYSVIVLVLGVWEVMRPGSCVVGNLTRKEVAVQVLDGLS